MGVSITQNKDTVLNFVSAESAARYIANNHGYSDFAEKLMIAKLTSSTNSVKSMTIGSTTYDFA